MFSFKCFDVRDDLCAMKVGTDGVLLGAWADVEDDERILDVGAGSGLISLMLAQRAPKSRIVALDIDRGAVEQSQRNFELSPWSERLEVMQCDATHFTSAEHFDHIVSNPPYFSTSITPPDRQRCVARFADSLDFDSLVRTAYVNLREGGKFSVVLPYERAMDMRRVAFERLWLTRQVDVVTKRGDEPKRVLMEFRRAAKPVNPRCSSLTIHDEDGSYSAEYRALTQEFYLKF